MTNEQQNTREAEVELLPCPFCGNDAVLFSQPDERRNVVCCLLGHAPMRTIEGWNTRAGAASIDRVEIVREIVEELNIADYAKCAVSRSHFDSCLDEMAHVTKSPGRYGDPLLSRILNGEDLCKGCRLARGLAAYEEEGK